MHHLDEIDSRAEAARRLRGWLSTATLTCAIALLAGTYLLISPPTEQTFPGAIPWSDGSWLRTIIDSLSFGHFFSTVRGVEIKDLVFHIASTCGLALLALRAVLSARLPTGRRTERGAWFYAQGFLGLWVGLSALSCAWSGDWSLSLGQAAVYGLALAWAISIGWTLESRHLPKLLFALVLISAAAACLCIWFYYERNPMHRPGFPLGNPSVLGAVLLPAMLTCGCVTVGTMLEWVQRRGRPPVVQVLLAAAALLPMAWAWKLADSRASVVALAAAIAAILLIQIGRRARIVVLVVVLAAGAAGGWWLYRTQSDLEMARGATIRFRLYAWRYAADLWSYRPITGHGAAAYPRLASQLAVPDRALDPAAFMGDLVEHAHNELFEIFTEIGLVGGVTFVGGIVATFMAAGALLRANLSPGRRWLVLGLIAGLVALTVDAQFGVTLRLSGAPAVFYTLVGALWALSRSVSGAGSAAAPDDAQKHMWLRRVGLAAGATVFCVGAAWLTVRNWNGVVHERGAMLNMQAGALDAALADAIVAEQHLLDPVRRLVAQDNALRIRFRLAQDAVARWTTLRQALSASQPASAPTSEQLDRWREVDRSALQRAIDAFAAAATLNRRAPTFGGAAATGAQCAEWLAELNEPRDAAAARQWRSEAMQAWRLLREQRPYNVEALSALTRYPGTLQFHIGLLRDALRSGFPNADWRAAFRRIASVPEFPAALRALHDSVAAMGPQTDLDSLVVSMAPETRRLVAVWQAMQGDFATAEVECDRAASLYRSLRTRFPELESVALAEQAEYVLLADVSAAPRALELLNRAIAALPMIQEQQYDELAAPFRLRMARAMLAADREDDAMRLLTGLVEAPAKARAMAADLYVELAQSALRRGRPERAGVRRWLDAATRLNPGNTMAWGWLAWMDAQEDRGAELEATLRRARESGVPEAEIERIRNSLRQEFPASAPAQVPSPPQP